MKKSERKSLLEEKIATTGIHQAIAILENELSNYEQTKYLLPHRYHIKQEMRTINRILIELEYQLNEVIYNARQWETPTRE